MSTLRRTGGGRPLFNPNGVQVNVWTRDQAQVSGDYGSVFQWSAAPTDVTASVFGNWWAPGVDPVFETFTEIDGSNRVAITTPGIYRVEVHTFATLSAAPASGSFLHHRVFYGGYFSSKRKSFPVDASATLWFAETGYDYLPVTQGDIDNTSAHLTFSMNFFRPSGTVYLSGHETYLYVYQILPGAPASSYPQS